MMKVNKFRLEVQANEILEAFKLNTVPIDPLEIAKEEGIKLCECEPHEGFFGRIECHVLKGLRKFLLFHPNMKLHKFPQQVRFSIGHELGHYYIDNHRKQLVDNKFHFSVSSFSLTRPLEREADYFSSVLLIPDFYLDKALKDRDEISMEKIIDISHACHVSLTSAAVRCAYSNRKEMVVILSKGDKIEKIWRSDDLPFGAFIDYKMPFLPTHSITNAARKGGEDFKEGWSSQDYWFNETQDTFNVYEEVKKLGSIGLYLTLLTF